MLYATSNFQKNKLLNRNIHRVGGDPIRAQLKGNVAFAR